LGGQQINDGKSWGKDLDSLLNPMLGILSKRQSKKKTAKIQKKAITILIVKKCRGVKNASDEKRKTGKRVNGRTRILKKVIRRTEEGEG